MYIYKCFKRVDADMDADMFVGAEPAAALLPTASSQQDPKSVSGCRLRGCDQQVRSIVYVNEELTPEDLALADQLAISFQMI